MHNKLANFWLTRYDEIGHTGWRDPIIYSYDQIERLAIVSAELDSLDVNPLTAIDFGCGTGDFCHLMLEKGFDVWGYDLYIQHQIHHPNFSYAARHLEIEIPDGHVGLVLSVTVLDHILDDKKIETELTYLRDKISEQGILLAIEYALDESNDSYSENQAFRTIDEWKTLFSVSGWQILNIKPIPHPINAPSEGFKHYRKQILVRLIGKFSNYQVCTPLLLKWLRKYARSVFNKHGIGEVAESPLKLILCRPI